MIRLDANPKTRIRRWWPFMAAGLLVLIGFGPALLLELLSKIDPRNSDGYAGLVIVWEIPFLACMFIAVCLVLIGIVLEIVRPFEKSR